MLLCTRTCAYVRTPQLTLVLAGGGYVAFLVLFLPLYAVSFLVTATGAWFVLLGAVYLGGRGLTRTISYPGASKQIQRDIELEYTKSVSGRLVSERASERAVLCSYHTIAVSHSVSAFECEPPAK